MCPPEDEGAYWDYRTRTHQYLEDFSGPNSCCIYNKNLYYDFMKKYKSGEKFDSEKEKEKITISV